MKVVTVDDHSLIREGLARVVSELGPDVEVIPADCMGEALTRLASKADVSLILLELMVPGADGLDRLECVRAARPEVPVVVFSASANHPATVRALVHAGARGVVSNRCPLRVLVEALRLVLVGGVYVPPEAFCFERAPAPAPTSARSEARPAPNGMHELGLTPRQTEVLELIAQGKPNKAICRALNIAGATVKVHVAAIYQVLGVSNRTEAVLALRRLGIPIPFVSPPAAARQVSNQASLNRAPGLSTASSAA